jgi:TonB family protein
MRRLFHHLLICLMLTLSSGAQALARPTGYESALESVRPQTAETQSAELEEANRLRVSMIKLFNEGKYDEAVPLAKRVLEIRQKVLGVEHQLVGAALLNLAEVYLAQRKLKDAETHYERALAIYEKTFGAEDKMVSDVLDRLALVQFAKGDNSKAEKLYLRSLAIREKVQGAESAEVASSLYKLAEFYQLREQYEKAESMYQRLLATREKKFGPRHEEVNEVLERYACMLRKSGKAEQADILDTRALGRLVGAAEDGVSGEAESVQAGVITGKALSLPKPSYPLEARASRITGIVKVRVVIDENGKVLRACAVSGPPALMRASEWAAMQARFSPTLLAAKPVKVTGYITYNFQL